MALDIEQVITNYNLAATAAAAAVKDDCLPLGADGDIVDITISTAAGGSGSAVKVYILTTLGTPAADEMHVQAAAGSSGRNNLKNALNGTNDAAIAVYGSGSDTIDGIAGATASNGSGTNTVKLTTFSAGASASITIGGVAGAWAPTEETISGTAEGGVVSFPLSDLGIGTNELTVAESEDDTGDYRKFLYHILAAYESYLNTLEAVSSVTITLGGSDYLAGDVITIAGGGGSGSTAEVATVDGSGAITGVTVLTVGSGFTNTPYASVTTTTAGSGCTFSVVLTAESPTKMSLTTTNLLAGADGATATKNYTVNFTFSLGVLDISDE